MDRRKVLQHVGLFSGSMIAGPALLSLLESCKKENILDWKPEFYTVSEAYFIRAMCDMLIPPTDTPGALDEKVDIFLDRLIANTYEDKAKQSLRSSIADFNANCEKNYGADFADLSDKDKQKALEQAEAESGKFNPGVWGTAVGHQEPVGFYRNLKSTIIWAYFTSQEIGEKVLSYDPIPGDYKGCVPLSDIGNRWSL